MNPRTLTMHSALTPTFHSKQCDLCEGEEFKTIAELDRYGKPLQTDVCLRCGLVMHHLIPTEEELTAFYQHQYRVDYNGEATPSSRRVMRAWKNGQRIQEQLSPLLKPASSVFEVGAGIGCTLLAFQRVGHSARGIEPHDGFRTFAAEKLNANVQPGWLSDLTVASGQDLILLIHVIEHLRSPRQALLRLRELLADQGMLYVECPNLAAPFATADRLFHYAHIHNFTPATLSLLARSCGFEVVKVFGEADDVNLQMLLRKGEFAAIDVPADAADATLRAAFRLGPMSYHFRPSYLKRRLIQIAGYALEHVVAGPYVRRMRAT